MSDKLVSVIVPVYNAEKHVKYVLEDILSQTYQKLEVIVVNDGSTDSTDSIIVGVAEVDRRVTIINTVHSGVSKARNIGLDIATGEYIRFVDADDRMPRDSIEKMVNPYQECSSIDMVIGNYSCVPLRNYVTGFELREGTVNSKEFIELFSKYAKSFYFGVTWNKLYKHEIIEKYHIRFDETIYWCEDFIFNIDYYSYCSFFYLLKTSNGIYVYYKHEGSITDKVEKNKDYEEEMRIRKLRYEKILNYCKKYISEEILFLEWKYAELFGQLSQLASKKNSGKCINERYNDFKTILKSEEIYKYVCMRVENGPNYIWQKLKWSMEKKKYWQIFCIFSFKEYAKTYFSSFESFIRKRMQSIFPKNF